MHQIRSMFRLLICLPAAEQGRNVMTIDHEYVHALDSSMSNRRWWLIVLLSSGQ
jgi:hypothetical protein